MPSVPGSTPPATILIVDDNKLGLLARKSVLVELGHRIVTCTEPSEALVLCSTQQFDLIVTDYKMPVMNGAEFITELRARSFTAPVILLSGFSDTLGLNQENTGADAVIQKSANEVSHLIRAVNRLLRGPSKKPPSSQPGRTTHKRTAKD
jgi:CheY-like chemotaxis protein